MVYGMTEDTRAGKDIDPIRRQIGSNVRAEMARASVNQAGIGEVLGLSRLGVGKRLAGVVGFEAAELVRIAESLAIPVARLVDVTSQPSTEGVR
jgi:hypothetical protein